jgi:DNA-directed RNA polymerase sigma subunit (sigma70/sigma32)
MSEVSDELNQKMRLLLNPRERSVMEMRLGVGRSRSLTLHEIGAELDISRE